MQYLQGGIASISVPATYANGLLSVVWGTPSRPPPVLLPIPCRRVNPNNDCSASEEIAMVECGKIRRTEMYVLLEYVLMQQERKKGVQFADLVDTLYRKAHHLSPPSTMDYNNVGST